MLTAFRYFQTYFLQFVRLTQELSALLHFFLYLQCLFDTNCYLLLYVFLETDIPYLWGPTVNYFLTKHDGTNVFPAAASIQYTGLFVHIAAETTQRKTKHSTNKLTSSHGEGKNAKYKTQSTPVAHIIRALFTVFPSRNVVCTVFRQDFVYHYTSLMLQWIK